jgi:CheY-like chemotaxis protein
MSHKILYIDDDQDDFNLLHEAFSSIAPAYEIIGAKDGMDGLELLEQFHGKEELPCLVILDLNMPRMDGKETFIALKKHPLLQSIPVVIFSTSNNQMDKIFFENKHVEYMVKPIKLNDLQETAKKMLSLCSE